jgi:hypothetical protein
MVKLNVPNSEYDRSADDLHLKWGNLGHWVQSAVFASLVWPYGRYFNIVLRQTHGYVAKDPEK